MKIAREIFKHKHIINSPIDESNKKLIKYLHTNNKHKLINNIKTSYSTQLKYVTYDNVSMSVGHLDHVLTVYSSMEPLIQITCSIEL